MISQNLVDQKDKKRNDEESLHDVVFSPLQILE